MQKGQVLELLRFSYFKLLLSKIIHAIATEESTNRSDCDGGTPGSRFDDPDD
jgi:hypothetical protein